MSESAFSAMVWGRPIDTGMVGGLSDLRNIDMNLIYIIKEQILPVNGYVNRITETLTPDGQSTDPDTGLTVTNYQSTYGDFVYYNPAPSNPALTGLLIEPILSTSGDLAWVDYPNGTIYYSGTKSNNITVTYDYYSVYVQDGYPELGEDPYDLESLRVPLISVDFDRRDNTPFTIGGGFQEDRKFMINILGSNDAQRDDIMDILDNSLRYDYDTTIDYRNGSPTLFNGTKNPNFDRGPASKWRHIRFADTYQKTLRMPGAPDKLRHQGIIMLTVQTN